MQAIWNDTVIAESNDTVVVEGNHYFPMSSLVRDYVVDSAHHTTCPWKGEASYYTLRVNGKENANAAWYYPTPSKGAEAVADRVAFWKGVQVLA
jgi:uncharacterized protein (DUF427 family)